MIDLFMTKVPINVQQLDIDEDQFTKNNIHELLDDIN